MFIYFISSKIPQKSYLVSGWTRGNICCCHWIEYIQCIWLFSMYYLILTTKIQRNGCIKNAKHTLRWLNHFHSCDDHCKSVIWNHTYGSSSFKLACIPATPEHFLRMPSLAWQFSVPAYLRVYRNRCGLLYNECSMIKSFE